MKRLLAALVLSACTMSSFALPTAEAVQAEIQRGNYSQAENMMREVVGAKPDSAKAHYVYAEVLAHNARFEQAAQEARRAKQLDPALSFTQAAQFEAFERLLDREQRTAAPRTNVSTAAMPAMRGQAPVERSSGVPGWVWGLGGAAAALLLWRMFSARRSAVGAVVVPAPAGYGGPAPTYGPGFGPGYGAAPSAGSGMLGTGLAVAGGLAAGMLAEKMLSGRLSHDVTTATAGGLVPGMFDDAPATNEAADELQHRAIDMGSGGDWGGSDAPTDGGDSDGW
jgi:hypothetical protein